MTRLLVLLTALGCGGDTEATDTDGTVGSVLTTSSTTNAFAGADKGHVTLLSLPAQADNDSQNVLAAVFVEADRGWDNLAQCLARPGTYCAQDIPVEEETWVPLDTFREEIPQSLQTRFVGERVSLGPFDAEYLEDSTTGIGYYFQDLGLPQNIGDSLSLRIPGDDWAAVEIEGALEMPTPMVVTSPDPLTKHYFHDARPVALRWEPGERGSVYLAVVTTTESRLYLLEDDGAFDIYLDELGLFDFEGVTLALGRWSEAILETPSGTVTARVQSDQYLFGFHREVGDRTELIPPDRCQDALEASPIESGSYWGDMRTFRNNLNPGDFGCTGFNAGGEDGILPISLEPQEYLEVTYQLPQDDASLYLVEDCTQANTCIVGVDDNIGSSEELLAWYNDSSETQEMFLVIDAFQYPLTPAMTDVFYLDVALTTFLSDVLADQCVDAMEQQPLVTGAYEGSLAGNVNRLDPAEAPNCGIAAPGGEGMTKVTLNPGQRITVDAYTPDADPILYWTWACNLSDSCIEAVNESNTSLETITWVNDTPYQENRYLVVDSASNAEAYYLTVLVE